MKTLFSLLLLLAASTVQSAVWFDPLARVWVGNLCLTTRGVDTVNPQPIGSTCFSMTYGTYGFIANR